MEERLTRLPALVLGPPMLGWALGVVPCLPLALLLDWGLGLPGPAGAVWLWGPVASAVAFSLWCWSVWATGD